MSLWSMSCSFCLAPRSKASSIALPAMLTVRSLDLRDPATKTKAVVNNNATWNKGELPPHSEIAA